VVTTNSTLYNYADDNTLAHADDNIDKIVETLEKDSLALIEWFSCNQMKANPDKFQALAIEFFLFYLYWLHYKSAMKVDRS
jgi:hypothetical protein